MRKVQTDNCLWCNGFVRAEISGVRLGIGEPGFAFHLEFTVLKVNHLESPLLRLVVDSDGAPSPLVSVYQGDRVIFSVAKEKVGYCESGLSESGCETCGDAPSEFYS